jgi:soluble lytic murein transglycosylase
MSSAGVRTRVLSAFMATLLLGAGGAQAAQDDGSAANGGTAAAPIAATAGTRLATYLATPLAPGALESVTAALDRAAAAARAGDVAASMVAYDEALAAAPQFADWIQLLAAQVAAEGGDTALVSARLAGSAPDVAAEFGWRWQLRARRVNGDLRSAIVVAEAAANSLSAAGRRAEAWFAAGDLHRESGNLEAARNAFRRSMNEAPGALAAVDAARAMSALPNLAPEDALLVGRTYIRHGNVERGVAGIDAYLAAGRATPAEQLDLRMEAGRALFNARSYDESERRLRAIAAEPVPTPIAAEALFLSARSQYRAGRTAQGLATFRQVIDRYPGQPVAAEAAFLVADLEQDDGRMDRARELFRRTMTLQPTSADAGLAAMRLGGLAYVEGDYQGALDIYEEYRGRFPEGRRIQQATYWAAQSYQRLGRADLARERLTQARALDPLSYYGLRAAEQLGLQGLAIALGPEPAAASEPRGEADVALFRLGLLNRVAIPGAAAFETERLRAHFDTRPNGWYVLAEVLNQGGQAYEGILLGREIQRREGRLNPRLLRIIYPFPYQDLVLPAARELGLDPFLVAGLIRQESMFNPAAVSPAGAIGLMQIIPSTGEMLARQLGLASFDPQRDLARPEINVRLGTRYLATRLSEYRGDVVSALAAYNAGAHRVERWALFPEYGDPELFAERIPFNETRDYVKIVQANAEIYRALYGR